MMEDKFSISVKGVLFHDEKFLLRKNQRNEFELLGGRLERKDDSPEFRVIQEFIEESGIDVEVVTFREPWLYVIAKKNIIIVPYVCRVITLPEKLFDQDGGELEWISKDSLSLINIPDGYIDSINNQVPRKSYSVLPGDFFKYVPNYSENDYFVSVRLRDCSGNVLLEEKLKHFNSPREYIEDIYPVPRGKRMFSRPIVVQEDMIYLEYVLI